MTASDGYPETAVPLYPEIVVASYQAGRFVMDGQASYAPGIRLYFDSHRIIRDGLGTRDGLHLIKVTARTEGKEADPQAEDIAKKAMMSLVLNKIIEQSLTTAPVTITK